MGILDAYNRPYTQHSFFIEPVLAIISNETVARRGFVFEELVDCLNMFPQICAESFYADQFKSPEDLANTLIQLMSSPEAYIIANFNRKVLGQKGGGHYSPLAAFDEQSHSVLILDVNERYGPYWADLDLLWKSMQRIDDQRHYPRGLILCAKRVR